MHILPYGINKGAVFYSIKVSICISPVAGSCCSPLGWGRGWCACAGGPGFAGFQHRSFAETGGPTSWCLACAGLLPERNMQLFYASRDHVSRVLLFFFSKLPSRMGSAAAPEPRRAPPCSAATSAAASCSSCPRGLLGHTACWAAAGSKKKKSEEIQWNLSLSV